MNLTTEQETVLSLIRTIVRGVSDVPPTKDIRWAKVMEEATKQGVQGLCFKDR